MLVVSKVAAEHKTYEDAANDIDETLNKMGFEYLDLMIIHSPKPWAEWRGSKRYFEENKLVWKALEDAYKAGKLKSIGVSNFLIDDLENLMDDCKIKPMVNQILMHIGNTPTELINFCNKENIVVEAYSPIAHGEAFEDCDATEKISYLSDELSTEGEPDGCAPDVGDFCLYALWGNLSIFYKDFRYSDSLILLGHIDSGIDIIGSMEGDFSARLEKAK